MKPPPGQIRIILLAALLLAVVAGAGAQQRPAPPRVGLLSGLSHAAIADRIQQISADVLRVQQGSLYPALYRLEAEGLIKAEWGVSDKNRKARFYELTSARRRRLTLVARFLEVRPQGRQPDMPFRSEGFYPSLVGGCRSCAFRVRGGAPS